MATIANQPWATQHENGYNFIYKDVLKYNVAVADSRS